MRSVQLIEPEKKARCKTAPSAVFDDLAEPSFGDLTEPSYMRSDKSDRLLEEVPLPKLSICLLIVGTHGDVAPFLGLATALQLEGHRVRLATHKIHRNMVVACGIEHFPLGGDPKVLSAWMVESGGTVLGEVAHAKPSKLAMLKEIVHSLWPAVAGKDPFDPEARLFVADAIIANPPTFGHIHVAEALGVPLHMMYAASPPRAASRCCVCPLIVASILVAGSRSRGRLRKSSRTR
jgi:hypothetical protein